MLGSDPEPGQRSDASLPGRPAGPREYAARIQRAVRRYGVRGLPKRAWVHVRRRAAGDQPLIYSRTRQSGGATLDGLTVRRFSGWAELDPAAASALTASEGAFAARALERQMDAGRVLWVASVDGAVAGYLLTARGDQVGRWLVPIDDEDVVVYSVVVLPSHRGRGVAPAFVERVVCDAVRQGRRAYIDTKPWNVSAIRFIDKAGFRPVVADPDRDRGATHTL